MAGYLQVPNIQPQESGSGAADAASGLMIGLLQGMIMRKNIDFANKSQKLDEQTAKKRMELQDEQILNAQVQRLLDQEEGRREADLHPLEMRGEQTRIDANKSLIESRNASTALSEYKLGDLKSTEGSRNLSNRVKQATEILNLRNAANKETPAQERAGALELFRKKEEIKAKNTDKLSPDDERIADVIDDMRAYINSSSKGKWVIPKAEMIERLVGMIETADLDYVLSEDTGYPMPVPKGKGGSRKFLTEAKKADLDDGIVRSKNGKYEMWVDGEWEPVPAKRK